MTQEVLVIGGGPAGTAAAIQLARGGVQVTLIEREREPAHKVCGEFLSGEALLYLQHLGIDLPALGAIPLTTVLLTGKGPATAKTLPFPAMSLTRRCLDAELLRHAEAAGVHVKRGGQVEHLIRANDTWQATLANCEGTIAPTVFLATGKHDLRGHPRPRGSQLGLIAFKMYWQLSSAEKHSLGSSVELITFRGGYGGLQPIESGLANLCCLIHRDELRRHDGKWDRLLTHMCDESPHLRRRLQNAKPQLAKPLTLASIPYGFVRQHADGLWNLGDQAVVIPSFTGDGMSLALHTGLLAASMYLQQESPQAFQKALAGQVIRQVALATLVSKAIVHAPRLALTLPRLWPGALSLIARQTRIAPTFLTAAKLT